MSLRIASISLYFALLNNLRGHFLSCHTVWRFNSLFVCKVCKMSLLFAANIACPLKSVCNTIQYFLVNWVQVSSIRRVRWYLDKRNSFNVQFFIFWSQASLAVRFFRRHEIEQGIYIDIFQLSSFSEVCHLHTLFNCWISIVRSNDLHNLHSPFSLYDWGGSPESGNISDNLTIFQSYSQKIWQSDNQTIWQLMGPL